MGEVFIIEERLQIIVRSVFHFYGEAADEEISKTIANDISLQWNEPGAMITMNRNAYELQFVIEGLYRPYLAPGEVIENTDPANNYFRIENFAVGNISFVDAIGSNTGFFLRENILHHSTTAAHEYGHTIGLEHPDDLDYRGRGVPGLMYPRGTLVDPEFQYDPSVPAGMKGGTLNPFKRKVLLSDIEELKIDRLYFAGNRAVLGEFTSVWHDAHQ